MASAAFKEIVEDFEYLDEWEDRYRYVIDKGKAMAPLESALKTPATKVSGCASQVWFLSCVDETGRFWFDGDSDAMIVRGLIAVLRTLYNGLPLKEVLAVDARAEFSRLGLTEHLSSQRSNGLRSMIVRIQSEAGALMA